MMIAGSQTNLFYYGGSYTKNSRQDLRYTQKNYQVYIYLLLLPIFGPIYYGPPS